MGVVSYDRGTLVTRLWNASVEEFILLVMTSSDAERVRRSGAAC